MKTAELETLIDILTKVKELKSSVQENDCDCDDDDEEEGCPLISSLNKDFTECMEWCFGKEGNSRSKKQARKQWQTQHPDLPMPRVLQSEDGVSRDNVHLCLMLDAYPLFLAHKNKKNT